MAWQMSGTYVANCSCRLVCPCPYDGTPTGPDDQCRGVAAFSVREGSLDETDLGGVNWAFVNLFPSNLTAGNWKFGVIVDEDASDEQAQAIERILHGDEGGPFADFAPLFGEWLGVERAAVKIEGGDRPSASIGDQWSTTFEPLEGAGGGHTTVKNAMYGFAPEFRIGNAPGRNEGLFGLEFDGIYGETADFEFGSEMAEGAPKGRV
jgi:hypothetical protein